MGWITIPPMRKNLKKPWGCDLTQESGHVKETTIDIDTIDYWWWCLWHFLVPFWWTFLANVFRSYQSNPHPISKQRGKTKKHEKTIVCPNYLRCISPKPKGGDTSRFHGASNASGSDDKMDEQLPDASSDLVTGRSFTSATNSWDLGMAKFFEVLVVTGSLPVWSGGSSQWPILFAKAWHHLVSLTPTKISDEGLTPRPAHAAIPRQHLQRHLLPTCVVKEGETSTHWTHWSIDHWWLPWATSNSYIYII